MLRRNHWLLTSLLLAASPASALAQEEPLLELPGFAPPLLAAPQAVPPAIDTNIPLAPLSEEELDSLLQGETLSPAAPIEVKPQPLPPQEVPGIVMPIPAEQPPIPDPIPSLDVPNAAESVDRTVVTPPSTLPPLSPPAMTTVPVVPVDDATPLQDAQAAPLTVDRSQALAEGISGSLMFEREQIEALEALIAGNRPEGDNAASDYLALLTGSQPAEPEPFPDHLAMRLDSILHLANNRWSAWVNGARLTPDHTDWNEEWRLADIGPRYAVLEWRPDARTLGLAKQRLTEGRKQVDAMGDAFRITLKPNQVFFAATMRVYEGKRMPQEVLAYLQQARAAATPATPETPTGDAASLPPLSELLSGLPRPSLAEDPTFTP